MEKPMLSFIIATYNDAAYIERCLTSIIKHMPDSSEIIIVDDGSTDSTAMICKRYCRLDRRIRYVYQSNLGVSAARNNGLSVSKGRYITFIDADDLVVDSIPTAKFDKWDIILFNYYKSGVNNAIKVFDGQIDKNKVIQKYIRHDVLNATWAKVYCRNFLISNNLFFPINMKIGEDAYFFGKCLEKTDKITFLNFSFYLYWYNANSVSNKPVSTFSDYTKLYKFKLELMRRYYPNLEEELDCRVFGNIMSALRSTTFNYAFYLKLLGEIKRENVLKNIIGRENIKLPLRRRVQFYFFSKEHFHLLYFELLIESKLLR